MKDTIWNYIKIILEAFSGTQASIVADYVKFKDCDKGLSTNVLLTLCNEIWDYFSIVGMGIAIIYFIMELNNKMGFESGNVTMKSFAMPFMKLGLAILMLAYAPEMMSEMLGVHDNFVDLASSISITDGVTLPSADPTAPPAPPDPLDPENPDNPLKKAIELMSLFELIGEALIPTVLIWLVSLVLNLVWIYKAISYKIELIFKISLTPLAIVDCYNTNSTAVIRWVKSVLGLVIYGGMLVILSRIGMLNAIATFTEDMGFLEWLIKVVEGLILPFAMLGASGAIKQVCREALS